MLYVGTDGALESLYIYRKQKPWTVSVQPGKKLLHGSSRAGTSLVRIYDRVRERQAIGKPPPFGPSPITRVEVIKRLVKRPLKMLGAIPNPLAALRVGFVESQFEVLHKAHAGPWLRYAALRQTHSSPESLRYLGEGQESALGSMDAVPCADIVASSNWTDWQVGLKLTGLADFIGVS